jgi:hypothetical protein
MELLDIVCICTAKQTYFNMLVSLPQCYLLHKIRNDIIRKLMIEVMYAQCGADTLTDRKSSVYKASYSMRRFLKLNCI